uniref:Plasmodium vivax Vir protein n=1 Tax=Loa loa TaxID=7209 RepID=A0A1I7VGE8_LOALO
SSGLHTLAYNETFSPFDLNTNVITTFVVILLRTKCHSETINQPTTLLPNNVYNPSELFKSSDSNENIDYDFFQKYIDNFNLSYFDPDPSEYNIDGEIPEEEQSHKRPHDRCDASFDNRDEYRKTCGKIYECKERIVEK